MISLMTDLESALKGQDIMTNPQNDRSHSTVALV